MQWDVALQGLDDWMQAQNTHPGIGQDIIRGLSLWQVGRDHNEPFTTMVAQEQALLGWDLMMLEGIISR